MVIIILAILSLFGIIFILLPVFSGKREKDLTAPAENKTAELEGHKNIIFQLLKDLEFEYKTGKISNSDFEKLREEYKNKVILIYKEMDQIEAALENTSTIITNNG